MTEREPHPAIKAKVRELREPVVQAAASFSLAPTEKRRRAFYNLMSELFKVTTRDGKAQELVQEENVHAPFVYSGSATELVKQCEGLIAAIEVIVKVKESKEFLHQKTPGLHAILEQVSQIVTSFIKKNWEV